MKWDTISLGDIALQKGGSVDPKKHPDEVFELYSIPAFDAGAPDVVTGSSIGSSKKAVQPNDVMISRIIPHIRRACIVGQANGHRQLASGEWIIFRDGSIWPQFLRWVLVGDAFHSAFMQTVAGVGGSLLRARPAQVFKIKVPLPPLAEQKRIAKILDAADALRAKRRESIAQLDKLLQSTFLDMFGDPVTNPMGWEETTFGDLFEISSSKRVLQKQWQSTGVPFYRAREIVKLAKDGSVDNELFISEELFDEFRRQNGEPQPGDLMVSAVGTLGACYLVKPTDRFYFKDASVLRFHPLGQMESVFLQFALGTDHVLRQVKGGSGSTVGTYTISRAKATRLFSPPLHIQHRFAAIVQSVEQQKATQRTHLAELDTLFASLQQRAFSGTL